MKLKSIYNDENERINSNPYTNTNMNISDTTTSVHKDISAKPTKVQNFYHICGFFAVSCQDIIECLLLVLTWKTFLDLVINYVRRD